MARPIVLVFQEVASPSTVPVAPDLNTLVVGPAYVIKDYPDDASTILISTAYGAADQPAKTAGSATAWVPPASGVSAVTVTSYPGNATGAIVDKPSVRVFLKTPRVIMGSTYLSSTIAPALGSAVTTSSATPDALNKITFAGGVDLLAAGIAAGDRIVLTDSAGVTLVRTVLSVSESGSNNVLRVTQNLPTTGWTFNTTGGARIERTLTTQEFVDASRTFITFPDDATNTMVLKGAIQLSVTITVAGVDSTVSRTLGYARFYLGYRALRQDLQHIDSCDDTQLAAKVGKLDARNPLAVGVSVALKNCPSGTPIYFYGLASNDATGHAKARDAISSRRDVYAIVPLTTNPSILLSWQIDTLGLADPLIASDTGVPQKFRAVVGSGTLPTATVISPSSVNGTPQHSTALSTLVRTITITEPSAQDIHTALPGNTVTIGMVPSGGSWSTRRGTHLVAHTNSTTQIEVLPGNTTWDDANADTGGTTSGDGGTEIQIRDANGVLIYSKLAKLAITYGSSTLTVTHKVPVTSGGPYRLALVSGATTAVTVSGFDITLTYASGTTVTQAVAAINASPDASAVVVASGSGSDAVTASAFAGLAITGDLSAIDVVENDQYYDILQDNGATFLTSGVLPGDLIEIPANPNNYTSTAFDGAMTTYAVSAVISENRLQITGVDDSPSVALELPHGYSRSGSGAVDVTAPSALNYRVRRVLSKGDQVTALIAIAQSFLCSRTWLVWPDNVIVDGLVDGSLTRTSPLVPVAAGFQPGYYAACAVGGAVAGLPAQHGLTNLGFAGITLLQHSSDYFTDRQLSQISDGGWFVLQQDTPTSAPYCIHQLSTDPSSVETGEVSVVKNIDYVSKYMTATLDPFIGRYNVTEDALAEINRALLNAMEALKMRKVARIGPPLIAGSVTSLGVSSISSDRVEIYLETQIPRPLNRIGLHLVVV